MAALVIAHRGGVAGTAAAENSIEAFEGAIEAGADMVELDVRRTRDGELIAFHDPRLGGRPVGSLSRSEIATRIGHEPALLAEVVELARGRVGLDVELKETGYVVEALATVEPALAEGRLLISSFNDSALVEAKRASPGVETGLLVGGASPTRYLHPRELFPISRARACGARHLLPHFKQTGLGAIGRASGAGLGCVPWTVNDDETLRQLLRDPRITAVITDVPARALELRGER